MSDKTLCGACIAGTSDPDHLDANGKCTYVATRVVADLAEAMEPVQEPAPIPGAFGRTVPTRVARRMLQLLMDLRVPVSVEYICADVALSVPFSYASTLDKTRETAERDLEMGMFAPCQVVKP